MEKKVRKDTEKKSLLKRILTFSPAKEKAKKAPKEEFIDREKMKEKFKLKRK